MLGRLLCIRALRQLDYRMLVLMLAVSTDKCHVLHKQDLSSVMEKLAQLFTLIEKHIT